MSYTYRTTIYISSAKVPHLESSTRIDSGQKRQIAVARFRQTEHRYSDLLNEHQSVQMR